MDGIIVYCYRYLEYFCFAGFILKILSFNIPWFALVIDLIAKWIIVVGIVCMIPSTWRWLIRAQNDLKQSNTKYDLSALRSYKFEQKLYSMRILKKILMIAIKLDYLKL